MKVIVYARVSTKEQKLESQLDQIKKYCEFRQHEVIQIYSDKLSGKNIDRTGFQKMMKDLESKVLPCEGLVIFKLDRIGRSVKDLVDIVSRVKAMDLSFISINDNIDTSSSTGRLFFHMMSAIAEYERDLILERTKIGRDYALAAGKKFGRKSKDIKIQEILDLKNMGVSITKIAKKFKVSRGTINNRLALYEETVKKHLQEKLQDKETPEEIEAMREKANAGDPVACLRLGQIGREQGENNAGN